MQTITMKSLPFYIIQNDECFELLDSFLASVESIDDEKTIKDKRALDKCVEILEASGYRMGFSRATLKCFEKQMLVSLSTEYRAAKRLALLGQDKNESFANWCNNRAAAKHSL